MDVFNLITLFGGLAMFLYGMRMMGDGLKEISGGALKRIMGKVTGTPVKAFLLGVIMTAVIQSSTATIVITSGLVGAGIITLHQSLGIIIGANVGTTVTGQIIRLLDLNASGASLLQFFKPSTLAPLALNSCNQVLLDMFHLAESNVYRAFDAVKAYDADTVARIRADEERLDMMADRASSYLVMLSAHVDTGHNVAIMNHYISAVSEFERLGDHAMNMAECAETVHNADRVFSEYAQHELDVLCGLIGTILDYTGQTFEYCNISAAQHIEPLEEVVDDMVNAMKQNHLDRLRQRTCSVLAGTEFLNMLSDIECISDICSNVGVFTIARAQPELNHEIHDYVSKLHSGKDLNFNREYQAAHDKYFGILNAE